MEPEHWKSRKVVIVGAGAVGSTFAYTLAQRGLADEIALLDANDDLAKGQVLDLAQGQAFFPSVHIRDGRPTDYADAALIVITAGAKQKPGETRLELVRRNAAIVESLIDEIVRQNSHAVVLIVSNPVDILTYVAHKRSGWPRGRIIGSGTVLDSARFRHLLSQHCGVDVHNVHGERSEPGGGMYFKSPTRSVFACLRCRSDTFAGSTSPQGGGEGPDHPKHHFNIAFCAWRRFSASSQTTDCGPSITSSVTSSPRCAGRQCMKIASFAARDISCAFT